MKILYKPFGIIVGIAAGFLARKVFNQVWSWFDDAQPPTATTLESSWGKVLGAAAVQGVTFNVTKAAVDRGGAKSFQWLTGIWPGDKSPAPDERD